MYLKNHSLDSTDFLDEVNDNEYSRVAGPEFWKKKKIIKKKKIDPFAGCGNGPFRAQEKHLLQKCSRTLC